MHNLMGLVLCLSLVACATTRTKYNDAKMRVSLDPADLMDSEYWSLRQALITNGHFTVVDRSEPFMAVVREQDLEHKDMQNRFEDEEKYAHYGKLQGSGSVIKMERFCRYQFFPLVIVSFWNTCEVTITLVDAATGQVVTQVSDTLNFQSPFLGVKSVSGLVDDLVDSYPEKFDSKLAEVQDLQEYKQQSKASATKAREDLQKRDYQSISGVKK